MENNYPVAILRSGGKSLWLGENKCDALWFKCLNPKHEHLVMIRVSETNPVSKYNGDKHLNVWKLTKMQGSQIMINPSVDASEGGCFHTPNPTYFILIDKQLEELFN